MSEAVYSSVFDRHEAFEVHPQTGKYDLVLGIPASIPPESEWEGHKLLSNRESFLKFVEGKQKPGEIHSVLSASQDEHSERENE